MNFDLVVIGGGPGGYAGAIRASKLGLKTALIEYRQLGGTCLNRGCIPTKALLHSAELFFGKNEWEELGIIAKDVNFDQQKVYERKDKIVSGLKSGVESLLKANGVEFFAAKGQILDKNTVLAGDQVLNTKNILIATGSEPAGFEPTRPLYGIENTLNSDDVLSTPIDEQDIVIVGGGVIAVEFASYFASIGKNTTILVNGDRILRNMSKEISQQLALSLKKRGLKIITDAKIKHLYRDKVEFFTDKGGEQTVLGRVITAVGRKANVDGIGLENVGVKFDKFIFVDNNMRTNVENIYACGDVIGKFQLAHFAAASAITAVESIAGQEHSMDLSVCPACIYTQPEIAVVGKTEPNENDKVGKFLMGANGKSLIEGVNRGYIKIIADQNGTVKGGELFAIRATDMVGEIALAVSKGLNAEDVASVIHAHPTAMEAIGEAAEDIFGLATHMMPKKR